MITGYIDKSKRYVSPEAMAWNGYIDRYLENVNESIEAAIARAKALDRLLGIDLGLHGSTPRGIDAVSTQTAFGDIYWYEYQYDDTSGSLLIGKPLYVECTDAAEYNSADTGTALSPAAARTGGKVVLGTNANVGASVVPVGVYLPKNRNDAPSKGDVVRALAWGRGIVSAQSPAAGSAGNVGGAIIASTTVTDAVPGARAAGLNIGVLLATGTHVAAGNQIFAAASATLTLCNGFVALN
jgi:hypothetical protein